jgi:hypothetical protein
MTILMFLPSDDAITACCAATAKRLFNLHPHTLLEHHDAVRRELVSHLENSSYEVVVFMCHGDEDGVAMYGHDKKRALTSKEIRLLDASAVFAYACFSAKLKGFGTSGTSCWGGYDYFIAPPPALQEVETLYRAAILGLKACKSVDDAAQLLQQLRNACDVILLRKEFRSATSEHYKFFENFWGRLIIFVPMQSAIVKHPEGFGGPLDNLYKPSSYPFRR